MQVLVAVLLLVFYLAFAQVRSSQIQMMLALSLPVLKWTLKHAAKVATEKEHNLDFAHGTGFYIEVRLVDYYYESAPRRRSQCC